MGPRLVDRGNEEVATAAAQSILASMGPRLVDRGNVALVTGLG